MEDQIPVQISMEVKKIVCSFANYPMSKGFERYRKEALTMNAFDNVYTFDEKDLDKEFVKKWGRYMYPYSFGYGYYCWKPAVIYKTLNMMKEGDILLYADLGCSFNPKGRKRLREYFDIVGSSESGILGFRSQEVSYNGREETLRYEYEWTKGDLFDYFGVRNDKSYTNTTQFEATAMLMKKCPQSMKFVEEWIKVFNDDFSLITNSPSRSPNLDGFIENRHDQSIYSLLAKKYKIDEVSTNEINTSTPQESWDTLIDCPIWAKRGLYYISRRHYIHRNKLRKLYGKWWQIKYFFKDLFN